MCRVFLFDVVALATHLGYEHFDLRRDAVHWRWPVACVHDTWVNRHPAVDAWNTGVLACPLGSCAGLETVQTLSLPR
jgi:hypothetical protein